MAKPMTARAPATATSDPGGRVQSRARESDSARSPVSFPLPGEKQTDRPTARGQFERVAEALIEAVTAGSTLVHACLELGVSANTARNWVTAGRKHPEGRYGPFARRLDAAREAASDQDDRDKVAGPVECEVEALISSRDLDGRGRIAAAQARRLARMIDRADGAAEVASASRRLEDLLDGLRELKGDAIEQIRAKREARIAAAFAQGGEG